MLDNTEPNETTPDGTGDTGATAETPAQGADGATTGTAAPRRRRRAASRPAGPPPAVAAEAGQASAGSGAAADREAAADTAPETAAPIPPEAAAAAAQAGPAPRTRRRAVKETSSPGAAAAQDAPAEPLQEDPVADSAAVPVERDEPRRPARRTRKKAAPAQETAAAAVTGGTAGDGGEAPGTAGDTPGTAAAPVTAEEQSEPPKRTRRTRKRAAAGPEAPVETAPGAATTQESTTDEDEAAAETAAGTVPETAPAAGEPEPGEQPARTRRRAARPPTALFQAPVFEAPVFTVPSPVVDEGGEDDEDDAAVSDDDTVSEDADAPAAEETSRRRRRRRGEPGVPAGTTGTGDEDTAEADADDADGQADAQDADEHGDRPARRRRRGGRRRRRGEAGDAEGPEDDSAYDDEGDHAASDDAGEPEDDERADAGEPSGSSSSSRRRRRRRRRSGDGAGEAEGTGGADDPERTVVKVREPRKKTEHDPDEVQSIKGSTRLEAKRQRRREGREQGRRRVPVITEAEFLARREAVERVMIVRQNGDRTQIGVLEDNVLVEHFVNKEQSTSYVGNVYLGKVQNVLPSMEAAFVDIGKGRNAVLYAGEVNFDALGMSGGPRRIESALKSGQSVLVQVTKDPMGHKGARLTSQVSLPGRYLVYVPEGSMTGISRKLPDTERARLKQILKKIVPEDAGVIVRTAAEGASEEELSRDVARLQAQWEEIQKKSTGGNAPSLLYGEPDMTVRVVRDIFNEDFSKVIVSGTDAWETIHGYVSHVAPDLTDRLQKWSSEVDVFATYRIDEQLLKALDRKVWLPSGGSLVIDRTEAMIVVDVNTGKFTGQGGNLEETVTRNNLEAAEEIVRQLRLRDLGGIIVIDFIDMVLESNRDLVLRRLLECLGRDRTKHQVAEVTSLGLVQMTRKRVGQGLLESFSETCVHCNGRGVIVHMDQATVAGGGGGKRRRKGKTGSGAGVPQHTHELPEPVERPAGPAEEVPEAAEEQREPEPVTAPAARERTAEGTGAAEPAVSAAASASAEEPKPARTRRRASRKATAPAGPPPSAAGDGTVVVVAASPAKADGAERPGATGARAGDTASAEPGPGAAPDAAEQDRAETAPDQAAAPVDRGAGDEPSAEAPAEAPAKRTAARKTAAKKTAAKKAPAKKAAAKKTAAKKTTAKKAGKKTAAAPQTPPPGVSATADPVEDPGPADGGSESGTAPVPTGAGPETVTAE